MCNQVDVELALQAGWLRTCVDAAFVFSVLGLQLCIVKSSFLFCFVCLETESSLCNGLALNVLLSCLRLLRNVITAFAWRGLGV